MVRIATGFDQREAIVYHTFCQSVIDRASLPVTFLPLNKNNLKLLYEDKHLDGSNDFTYLRFLVPYLFNYSGWVIYADGDMVCNTDICKLWNMRDNSKAVQVVKHDYTTKQTKKYFSSKNENYPRKNWSSLILWNCSHAKNKILTPEFIAESSGQYLHRFSWLDDNDIGEIPITWNWLAVEYEDNYDSDLVHYTLGSPCFKEYRDTPMANLWYNNYFRAVQGLDLFKY